MRLLYVAPMRMPTEKAHGIHIAHMCAAFARAGVSVTLVVPRRRGTLSSVAPFYGLEDSFEVAYLPTLDFTRLGWVGFWLNQFSFALLLFLGAGLPPPAGAIVFTRDALAAWILHRKGYRVFFDLHGVPRRLRPLWKAALSRMEGVVVTNAWKVEPCAALYGVSRDRILVAHNGFDPRLFKIKESRRELRAALSLPADRPVALYTGHLYDWKGAEVLARAARMIPDALVVFVGGTPEDLARFGREYGGVTNIRIEGWKPHAEIPRYLRAADVLVLPNSNVARLARFAGYSKYETSPLKLFEYMASGTPVVASDLPAIREIVGEDCALLVPPDDPGALAEGIRRLLRESPAARRMARRAKERAAEFTWDRRAERILSFIRARGTHG